MLAGRMVADEGQDRAVEVGDELLTYLWKEPQGDGPSTGCAEVLAGRAPGDSEEVGNLLLTYIGHPHYASGINRYSST